MASNKTLIFGDVHLRHGGSTFVAEDLLSVLKEHTDADLVFAGDTLDLAAEPTLDPVQALKRTLAAYEPLQREIARRASHRLVTHFIAGNHDTCIARDDVTSALYQLLRLEKYEESFVQTTPWFLWKQNGSVHIEHGHVFDPDSAPIHPFAPEARDDVGIAILRGFIVPFDAYELVHANGETPFKLLSRVVEKYGAKAPLVVASYIKTAFKTVFSSGKKLPIEEDLSCGALALRNFATAVGFEPDMLEQLIDIHATPTRTKAMATFMRLYLDRVSAVLALSTGLSLGSWAALRHGKSWSKSISGISAATLASLGALSLTVSLLLGKNRYAGRTERYIAEGAEAISSITGAKHVVLGHIHLDRTGPHYQNTASFAFPPLGAPGRPYLILHEDGCLERAWSDFTKSNKSCDKL